MVVASKIGRDAEDVGRGGRCFLFLQGPHGPFFPLLGAALERGGHRVVRVNFNGGDAGIWRSGIDYHGTLGGWPNHLRRLLRLHRVTDLVLYGDGRPLHAAAISVARSQGVRVHVFEEGYLRPDWVTLERDGVNGYSTLPRHPEPYRAMARELAPLPDNPPLPSISVQREWSALWYYLDIALNHWRFPFYRSHRATNPLREMVAYLRRAALRKSRRRLSLADEWRMQGKPFFLFPLQLNSDFQIVQHSPFKGMEPAIRHVLNSFARHAPPDVMLAIKEHPLDLGVIDWRRVVERLARSMGLAHRVAFLEHGDLQALVKRSRGMVTVNSTSGTLALTAGKPVKVLGNAVYDMACITDQQSLDTFWCAPVAPDAISYDAFCRVLGERCLLPGAFLNRRELPALIEAATIRLLAQDVEVTAPASRQT